MWWIRTYFHTLFYSMSYIMDKIRHPISLGMVNSEEWGAGRKYLFRIYRYSLEENNTAFMMERLLQYGNKLAPLRNGAISEAQH